jgi:small basic protein (TIGR04137 family)
MGLVDLVGPRILEYTVALRPQQKVNGHFRGTIAMTMDKSLRVRKGSSGARGVLSRAERITKLQELERWEDGRSPLGLPKVRVYKMSMKKKKSAKPEEAAEAAGKAKKK